MEEWRGFRSVFLRIAEPQIGGGLPFLHALPAYETVQIVEKERDKADDHRQVSNILCTGQKPETGECMEIREVAGTKKQYLSLLLLADEQEDMIDRYLQRGTMYVLDDGGIRGECVVTDEGTGVLEIKNIATEPDCHGKGYGRAMIEFVAKRYAGQYSVLQVGTGDSPLTVPFYEKCGFVRPHRIRNFFTDNYDHPVYEGGIQLVDMVYLQKKL